MTKNQQKEITPEQIKEGRRQILLYMQSELEYLELRSKYTRLTAEIAENITREKEAHVKLAHLSPKPKDDDKK